MSSLQEEVIKDFQRLVGKRTFTEYAKISGIERTRIFRLFNGADMKLTEYEKLNKFILSYTGVNDLDLHEKIKKIAGTDLKQDIEIAVKRKIELNKLLKTA